MTKLAVFGFLTLLFAAVSHAQICGPSITKIYVVDGNGNAVKGAKFEFPDVKFDMDKLYGNWFKAGEGAYTIHFDHNKPYGFHMLRIDAPGYLITELRIMITEAQRQIFRIIVRPLGSKVSNYTEQLFAAWGQITSVDKKAIAGSKIIFTNDKKKQFTTISSADGGYSFELPNDLYDIEVYHPNSNLAAKYESFRVSNKTNHVDVVLDASGNGKIGNPEMVCKPDKYEANEEHCVLMTKTN